MSDIKVLDCTLRDGGYINEWHFGRQNIKRILSRLTKAGIDIIECGFLEDGNDNPECSLFSNVRQIAELLPTDRGQTQYVAMTRYGFLDLAHLSDYDGTSIEGIRVTFHEDEASEAIEYCKQIKAKGYKVYVQPVGTTSYTDRYLLQLIEIVNQIKPYAFYIVDTLGLMRKNDLLRMYYLVDNNLESDIVIGFHSHNNLQLSFSNSQELAHLHTKRTIILDSSVYGMGRGAGNLNTELIAQHLNFNKDRNYKMDELLEIIDESISPLLAKYSWGYSAPYYLAAINNCHPNYATYLMNRKTLPVKSISNILTRIEHDKRELYDEKYVAELYMEYQEHNIDDRAAIQALAEAFEDREIVIVAPGTSVRKQNAYIQRFIEEHRAVVISVNFDGDEILPDYCFFSNDRRFQNFIAAQPGSDKVYRLILASNIKAAQELSTYIINYSSYVNTQPLVNDNATLMLIALLISLQVKGIHIAGFDGFQSNTLENYAEGELELQLEEENVNQMNGQISEVVRDYSKHTQLNFITESKYAYLPANEERT